MIINGKYLSNITFYKTEEGIVASIDGGKRFFDFYYTMECADEYFFSNIDDLYIISPEECREKLFMDWDWEIDESKIMQSIIKKYYN